MERGKAAQEERESLEPKLLLLQKRSHELQKQVSDGTKKNRNMQGIDSPNCGLLAFLAKSCYLIDMTFGPELPCKK